jgi:hypothetical protein
VALVNASMFAFVACSSASRNLPQRTNRKEASGSGLKGCSAAQALAQSRRDIPPSAAPATAVDFKSSRRRISMFCLPVLRPFGIP